MSNVFAAPAASAPAALPGAGSLLQVSLSLLVVIALVLAFGWLARRMRSMRRPGGARLEVLAETALGTRERAVLLQVGRTRLLLGVATGSVRTLHVLSGEEATAEAPGEGAAAPATTPGFRELLLRSLGR